MPRTKCCIVDDLAQLLFIIEHEGAEWTAINKSLLSEAIAALRSNPTSEQANAIAKKLRVVRLVLFDELESADDPTEKQDLAMAYNAAAEARVLVLSQAKRIEELEKEFVRVPK